MKKPNVVIQELIGIALKSNELADEIFVQLWRQSYVPDVPEMKEVFGKVWELMLVVCTCLNPSDWLHPYIANHIQSFCLDPKLDENKEGLLVFASLKAFNTSTQKKMKRLHAPSLMEIEKIKSMVGIMAVPVGLDNQHPAADPLTLEQRINSGLFEIEIVSRFW